MLRALIHVAERTVALLAFEDARSCPVADLMDIAQRQKTASELNAAILASQCQVRWTRAPVLALVPVRRLAEVSQCGMQHCCRPLVYSGSSPACTGHGWHALAASLAQHAGCRLYRLLGCRATAVLAQLQAACPCI